MNNIESKLVGRRCGIVQSLGKAKTDFDDPAIHAYGASLCDTSAFSATKATQKCGGGGIEDEEAKYCCLGEAIERYCAGVWNEDDITWARADELRGEVFPIQDLVLFSKKQYRKYHFPYVPISQRTTLPWIKAQHYHRASEVWVPACFFLLPSPQHDQQISPPISTGLACHTSFEEAYVRGLCECIERDAVSLMWLRGVIPPQMVNIKNEKRVAKLLEDFHGEVTVGDLSSDQKVPTYFCLLEGNSPCGNIISFGAACHKNSDDALYKAVREAALGRIYVKRLIKSRGTWEAGYKFHNVNTFDRHASFYSLHPKYYKRLAFLKAGKKIPYTSYQVEMNIKFPAYVRDLTTPEIRELGLYVVKTWVPKLLPLHGHHLLPFLGHPRLDCTSQVFANSKFLYKKGYNPWPHPMP
ncbi:YcaO-like family protein [Candidatus Uabimicrobium amorphum]|uniref:Streptolysin associated protein SagD n=1 Tax=Uabimicrobium amorphum TaxID=2596890 RepID=A0A5S9F3U5_UABAM|nr:YcaO-like family protein [Candidatus Uabimicrobium amorphum]BBM83532.1 streptolysin associated protein SagD [Candidatus Uabimicrobium amorphum]